MAFGIVLLSFYSFFSSFDEYSAEVKSGRLEWSPVHRSDKFWVICCKGMLYRQHLL